MITACVLENGVLRNTDFTEDILSAGLPAEGLRVLRFSAEGDPIQECGGGEAAALMRSAEAVPAGGGLLAVIGDWYTEPEEAGIDLLKSSDSRSWLEHMIIRHIDRIRMLDAGLYAVALREG